MMRCETFNDGQIKLYCGDCQTVTPTLKLSPKNIDCALIDPPYNIGYKYNTYKDNLDWKDYYNNQKRILLAIRRILKPKGSVLYLNYPEQAAIIWGKMMKFYHPIEWITWIYHQHTGGKPLRKATRVWLWMAKSNKTYVGSESLFGEYRNPTDKRIQERIAAGFRPIDYDWFIYEQVKNVSKEKTEHPCQLPLEMVERLVVAACPLGGTVFDPYMGSATTAVACLRKGRKFIGVESDEQYFEISLQRIQSTINENSPTKFMGLFSSGQTFSTVGLV
jgi:site-specific DNA-methyltransferase (adenine-specific)